MLPVKIRKASEKDIPDILFLIRELAEFEHGLNEVTNTEKDLLRDGFGDKKLFECFVAESEEGILGLALYFYTYSTWNGKCLYLEDLIVRRNVRTKGIGTKLMNKIILTAKENDVKRISWQVLDWNADALDFYKKFGARVETEWLNVRLNQRQLEKIVINEGL